MPASHTDHPPRPVLPARYLALEVEVLDRMILGGGREAVIAGRLRQALGQRPAGQHAVVLQAQIPMQAPGVVLLDHEAPGCGPPSPPWPRGTLSGGRLGRGGEVTFGAVGASRFARPRRALLARVPFRHA